MSALELVLTFIITSPAMTSAAGDDGGRGRLLTKDRHVDQKGADCADAGPDRIGGAQGIARMASARRPTLPTWR